MTNESEQSFAVVIIGGGPAGMSAAMGFLEGRVKALLIDRQAQLGGQLADIPSPIVNLAGAAVNNGEELRVAMQSSLERAAQFAWADEKRPLLTLRNNCHVLNLAAFEDFISVETINAQGIKSSVRADFLIFAGGYRVRQLEAPTAHLANFWQYHTDNLAGQSDLSASSLAVVGGGDSALLKAISLAPKVKDLHLIHRGKNFTARPDLITKIAQLPNCRTYCGSKIAELIGAGKLERIKLDGGEEIAVSAVIVKVGYEPNTELLEGLVKLNEKRHVIVDHALKSSHDRIYAAGDIINEEHARISTAVGNGMKAAGSIMQRIYHSRSETSERS
ncbi:MAG: NAD(P)/FAD-dependent oxidoreductase [Cyanobacteria bacterium REEB67]|nr:NAD(P)/FAD-dependent oxidoreductase [Cyanobacteria bacterium REEB67]